MLVGVGGSGRKSMTTLAAFICDMKEFQIQISKVYGKNEWRDDLRTVLRMAGEAQGHTVFLFGDTQIKREGRCIVEAAVVGFLWDQIVYILTTDSFV